jgi:hypothetical protein
MFHFSWLCFSKFDVTSTLEQDLICRCDGQAAEIRDIIMKDSYFDDEDISLTSNNLWLRQRNSSFELKWPRASPSSFQTRSAIDEYNESSNWDVICAVIKQFTSLDLGAPPPCPLLVPHSSDSDSDDVMTCPQQVALQVAWLRENKLIPFAVMETHRTRFPLTVSLPEFDLLSLCINVDIDTVTYQVDAASGDNKEEGCSCGSDWQYRLGEVELVTPLPAECDPSAVMAAVCQDLGILPLASAPSTDEPSADHALSSSNSNSNSTGRARRGKVEEFLLRFRPEHYLRVFANRGDDDEGRTNQQAS